jgi:hypothetical protein
MLGNLSRKFEKIYSWQESRELNFYFIFIFVIIIILLTKRKIKITLQPIGAAYSFLCACKQPPYVMYAERLKLAIWLWQAPLSTTDHFLKRLLDLLYAIALWHQLDALLAAKNQAMHEVHCGKHPPHNLLNRDVNHCLTICSLTFFYHFRRKTELICSKNKK